ncbi:MAG: hypothetical protein ACI8W8_004719, partial [Rhodothermales bacterium]
NSPSMLQSAWQTDLPNWPTPSSALLRYAA